MSFAVSLFRGYYRILGAVAPNMAARSAAKLFLTPLPRAKATRWPSTVASRAERFTIYFGQHKLPGWRIGRGPKKVLICHGWGGCAGQMSGFVEALVDSGYQVVAFDGPAHGDSPAKQTNLVEFTYLLRELQTLEGPFAAAIGHSFGGAAIIYALGHGFQPDRVVLMAPFADSDRNVANFARYLGFSESLHQLTRQRLLAFFTNNIDGWNLISYAKKLTVPMLAFHDADDDRIDRAQVEGIVSHWQGSELFGTNGLGHRRILKDHGVISRAVQFIQNGHPSLSSKAG